jgi:hypothetical protein
MRNDYGKSSTQTIAAQSNDSFKNIFRHSKKVTYELRKERIKRRKEELAV